MFSYVIITTTTIEELKYITDYLFISVSFTFRLMLKVNNNLVIFQSLAGSFIVFIDK